MTVTSLSDSAALPNVLTKFEPPFAVIGATNKPFLATIELVFNGVSDLSAGQTIRLEHWVEVPFIYAGYHLSSDFVF